MQNMIASDKVGTFREEGDIVRKPIVNILLNILAG